jgi:hypothetical protein
VEVRETGDSSWSLEPDSPMPGKSQPVVIVLVSVDDASKVDAAKLDAVIRASKPAHVAHQLKILETRPKGGGNRQSTPGDAKTGATRSVTLGTAEVDVEGKSPA